jgi:tripartite-type tricarboxylate transporter receptor subunit TctC
MSDAEFGSELYPSRDMKLVVPFRLGFAFDFLTRLIGPRLEAEFRHPVIIANMPGNLSNFGQRGPQLV